MLFIANIKIVLTVILIVIIIIFPIFINVKIFFDNTNLLRYKISLFNIIRVFCGNIEALEDGIVVHLTRKNAILVPYFELINLRKKFEPIKDFHLIQFISNIEISAEDALETVGIISFSYLIFTNVIKCIINTFKPYVNIKTNVNVMEESDIFKIKVGFILVFNLLIVIISAIKILMEKIIYAIKNKRKQSQ